MKRSQLIFTLFAVLLAGGINAQLRNGDIVKIKNVNSNKYAKPAVLPAGKEENNAQLVLYTGSDDARQKWKVIAAAGGYFKFQNMQTNLFLGVLNKSKEQYGFICQRMETTAPGIGGLIVKNDDLLWKLERTAKGFKLKNKNSGLVAAVEGGGKNNDAKIIQWADQGQPDIQWQFEAAGTTTSTTTGKKVLFDVTLNYVAVSEATRNQIDNGDCKRVFGSIATEIWELNDDNEMVARLQSYNNMPELIYHQPNYQNPPTAALSYYQDNKDAHNNSQMGRVTYNLPETLLKQKKLMLVVKTNLGTRHKDNDFATYDALRMAEETTQSFILFNGGKTEMIEAITDLNASSRDMHVQDWVIPFAAFQRTDDTHKIWVKITYNKK